MANISLSLCPSPFLDLKQYPFTGGYEGSRLCAPVGPTTTCCLPCPISEWVYPDNFSLLSDVANWIALGSVVCCCILLLSFVALPAQRTGRHYLTICLVIGVGLLTAAFVVPLGASPDQCHDAITPNDMKSNLACAFSGSLVLFGGFSSVMWVFVRSLSLHLQICWQIVPGRKFFWGSLAAGWLLPCISLASSLALPGVSYRFGQICHINHTDSLGTFWGPLLGFTGMAAVMQFSTFIYCIRVYLRSLWDSSTTTTNSSNMASSGMPSVKESSIKTLSAGAAYRRVRKVIALQWRGITVVMIVIITLVYLTIIFLKLDNVTVTETKDPAIALPWLTCLIEAKGNKNKCLVQAGDFVVSEAAVIAVLYMIASMGYWCVLFLGRGAMFRGWLELIRRPFQSKDNFVSVDARRFSDPRNYEMLTNSNFQLQKGSVPFITATATLKDIEAGPDRDPIAPVVRDFSPSRPGTASDQPTDSEMQRIASHNFSLPRGPEPPNSHHVTFSQSRDGPLSRFPETASDLEDADDRLDKLHSAAPYFPARNRPNIASSVYSGQWDSPGPVLAMQEPLHTAQRNRISSIIVGPHQPLPKPTSLDRQRSNSALGREWSVGKSSPAPQAGRPGILHSNSTLQRGETYHTPRSAGAPEILPMASPGRPVITRNASTPSPTHATIDWDPTSSYAQPSVAPGRDGGVGGWH